MQVKRQQISITFKWGYSEGKKNFQIEILWLYIGDCVYSKNSTLKRIKKYVKKFILGTTVTKALRLLWHLSQNTIK